MIFGSLEVDLTGEERKSVVKLTYLIRQLVCWNYQLDLTAKVVKYTICATDSQFLLVVRFV